MRLNEAIKKAATIEELSEIAFDNILDPDEFFEDELCRIDYGELAISYEKQIKGLTCAIKYLKILSERQKQLEAKNDPS